MSKLLKELQTYKTTLHISSFKDGIELYLKENYPLESILNKECTIDNPYQYIHSDADMYGTPTLSIAGVNQKLNEEDIALLRKYFEKVLENLVEDKLAYNHKILKVVSVLPLLKKVLSLELSCNVEDIDITATSNQNGYNFGCYTAFIPLKIIMESLN